MPPSLHCCHVSHSGFSSFLLCFQGLYSSQVLGFKMQASGEMIMLPTTTMQGGSLQGSGPVLVRSKILLQAVLSADCIQPKSWHSLRKWQASSYCWHEEKLHLILRNKDLILKEPPAAHLTLMMVPVKCLQRKPSPHTWNLFKLKFQVASNMHFPMRMFKDTFYPINQNLI